MEPEPGCCTSSTKTRLMCVLSCVLSCFLSTACLVTGLVLDPYSQHPSAAIVSGVQLGCGFLGSVAASVMLCCCHSGVALVLLQSAALGLGSTAIGLAFVCVQACALVVPAYEHDWLALASRMRKVRRGRTQTGAPHALSLACRSSWPLRCSLPWRR